MLNRRKINPKIQQVTKNALKHNKWLKINIISTLDVNFVSEFKKHLKAFKIHLNSFQVNIFLKRKFYSLFH